MDSKANLNEVIRIEDQINENKKKIKLLKIENMKGNALCLSLDVKLIKKSKSKATKTNILTKFENRLVKVQKRIKATMDKSADFNIWGFNSHIIANVIKCRVLEDLIHCA